MKLNYLLMICLLALISMVSCTKPMSTAPILIIATNSGFGTYTSEILKAEGLNEFIIDSLNSKAISKNYLAQFDIVILAENEIAKEKKELIEEYVKTGGKLIAFRPDKDLSGIFGIEYLGETIDEGYINIAENSEQGKGITTQSIQFHGIADKYRVQSAKIIASIIANKDETETFPGVVISNYGQGQAIAFLYNLPKSIVYTRQGNPLFAGIEKDGIPGLRGTDLFTDGWVDTSKNTLNQADQQMTLLSNCIQTISNKPLPRFWYFPDTLKCLVTLTNDGEFRSETDFEPQLQDVDSMGAKMSLYLLQPEKVSKEWVDKWIAKGFEIAGHPDDTKEAGNPDWNNMDGVIKAKKSEIAEKFGLQIRTNVNHWFVWCGKDADGNPDFAAQSMLEEINAIELDINYAHYDIKSNQGDNYLGPLGTNQGNFTGTGLPMKFANVNGKIINVYQQFNAVYDQQYNESHDPEGFFNCFKGLMDRSLNDEVYSFISVKAHNDEYYFSKKPLMKMLAYANSHGIPVWTAVNQLDFIKTREEASFTNTSWSNNILSFNLNSSIKNSNGLTIMILHNFGNKKIKGISKNGDDASFIVRKIKGSAYALLTVEPGKAYQISVTYK